MVMMNKSQKNSNHILTERFRPSTPISSLNYTIILQIQSGVIGKMISRTALASEVSKK
jgi:hypothetical protein